jgi:hypothetical protein
MASIFCYKKTTAYRFAKLSQYKSLQNKLSSWNIKKNGRTYDKNLSIGSEIKYYMDSTYDKTVPLV